MDDVFDLIEQAAKHGGAQSWATKRRRDTTVCRSSRREQRTSGCRAATDGGGWRKTKAWKVGSDEAGEVKEEEEVAWEKRVGYWDR